MRSCAVGRGFTGSEALSSRRGGRGRSGAEPSVPTLAAQTVLRVSYRKGRCAARVLIGLRPLHLCGTRLEGGHRRLSRTLRFAWVEPKRVAASSAGTQAKARGNVIGTGTSHRFRMGQEFRERPGPTTAPRNGSPFIRPYRRERPWYPPSRRVPHKWSGRRPDRYMGRVSGLSLSSAEDCLSSEGGHQGLPRETPKCRARWRSRAREAYFLPFATGSCAVCQA
ncbi:hypothetical protein C8J98_101315 [Luteibacter sp. OK325]|nr:hypothetical protein C8J98_101315 [Luteibacter sp. OK325]